MHTLHFADAWSLCYLLMCYTATVAPEIGNICKHHATPTHLTHTDISTHPFAEQRHKTCTHFENSEYMLQHGKGVQEQQRKGTHWTRPPVPHTHCFKKLCVAWWKAPDPVTLASSTLLAQNKLSQSVMSCASRSSSWLRCSW